MLFKNYSCGKNHFSFMFHLLGYLFIVYKYFEYLFDTLMIFLNLQSKLFRNIFLNFRKKVNLQIFVLTSLKKIEHEKNNITLLFYLFP